MATAKNTNIVRSIAAPAGAVGDDCTHVSLWDAQQAGNLLASKAISTNPEALALGERYEIAGGLWVQYHTGAPGVAGGDNIIAELGRTGIPQADWTVSAA